MAGKRIRDSKISNGKNVQLSMEANRPVKKSVLLIAVVLIAALGFTVYANSLSGKFLWDDDHLVRENTYIRGWSNIPEIFSKDIGAGAMVKFPSYRPIQILTYVFDYSFWKLNPFGYHLTNILFHIFSSLCIFWFINILFGDWPLSLLTSVLFAVHPAHTSAVSYISGRADSIALLFILLTLIFYIKYNGERKPRDYIVMFLCYTVALWARENSLIMIGLIFLYHYTFKKKLEFKQLLPVFAITLSYVVFRLTVLRPILFLQACEAGLFKRIISMFAALANYLRLLILPFNLHMEYGYRQFYFKDPEVLSGIAILFLLLMYACKNRKKNTLAFFSCMWFLTGLLPVSNIYPINAYMAEHWLYLPSIGFFLLFSSLLRNLYRHEKLKTAGFLLIAGVVLFYFILTVKQNNYWQEPVTFYERTLKYFGQNYRILNNLANIYNDAGRYKDAVALYEKALIYEPKSADVYYNLGNAYANMGNKEMAAAAYKKSVELDQKHFRAYINLGSLYYHSGNYDDALSMFNKAAEIEVSYPLLYNNIGVLYSQKGDYAEAIMAFKNSMELEPDNANTACALAQAYYNNKEYDMAIVYCDKAIKSGYKMPIEFIKLLEPYRK